MLSIKTSRDVKHIFICVTGMPGSGKSLVVSSIKHLADMSISMGDVIRREAVKRGIKPTSKSLMELAKEVRKEYGSNYVAMEVVKEVSKSGAKVVVVDGVRSLDEVNIFKKFGDVYIIAIHSSPKTRFLRLSARGREGDPKDWYEFVGRDMAELELGVGSVIALADLMIVNEDLSVEDLTKYVVNKVRELVRL
ncbi:MAG: AAA family ATPase [Sulfolobales archaeon]